MKSLKHYTLIPFICIQIISEQAIAGNPLYPYRSINTGLPAATAPGDDWYAAAVQYIQQLENKFYPQQQPGLFRVANTHNRIGFHINATGYTVHNIRMQDKQPAWEVHFTLAGIGRSALQWQPGKEYSVAAEASSLIYSFAGADVEYHNNAEGLRQNFIVREKITGKGHLKVFIELSGNLAARLNAGNQLAFYETGSKELKLLYEQLKVWDAQQRPLPSRMILNGSTLILEVDDRRAEYPVTIDPLNKTPEWTTSVDGVIAALSDAQLKAALYGFTVTGLGDVNGDGFGDVAVSAPALVDVFSGSGSLASVGAVFVYYGSSAGLSTIPDKTLQPNTAVAGALFGFSVAAGDVTGDGINDVIAGAPLDSYQTQAQGLLGPSAVTVNAGKVYVYQSNNFSGANPSGFLEVRLQGASFFSTGVLGVLLNNVNVNALFGYSVAATDDLNGDGRADLLIGSPSYLGAGLLSVQNGSAFVYYSNNLGTTSPVQLQTPPASLLGLVSFPVISTSGLLFGFSVDGAGDYNNDGYPDVVVGAPAGIDLSSLGSLFTGQVLGGSAYVYYGNGSGITNTIGAQLQAASGGLLGNAANLFGYVVKGARNAAGSRTGHILASAPVGGLIPNTLSLTIQTGNVHVFKRKSNSPSGPVTSDQQLESPRSASVLNVLNTLDLNVLFGASIDNAYDINCDGIGDLVAGEPLSSGATLLQLQTNAVGGAAYVFLGDGTGGYVTTPIYSVSATHGDEFLSVNATAMFGFSVAGAPLTRGAGSAPRIIAGAPSGALDFDNSLLNLGSTIGLLFNFAAGDNGLGKAYAFDAQLCIAGGPLPVTLVQFSGQQKNNTVSLYWKTSEERNITGYEVQRSANGTQFETIGLVFSWENSFENEYRFPDEHPLNGANHYRLKILDNDEGHKYSGIINVRLSDGSRGQVIVAPNPVTDRLRVKLSGLGKGAYHIEVRDITGNLHLQKKVHVSQYEQAEVMDRPSSMPAGIYWLTVYDAGRQRISTFRVIVQ